MAQIILLFDVSRGVKEFRRALEKEGYTMGIGESAGFISLPENSLYHPDKQVDKAVDEATSIGFNMGVTVLRCAAFEFNQRKYSGIAGSPKNF